jgi:NAD+ kinase
MAKISKVEIFHRADNIRATAWSKKIKAWINRNYPKVRIGSDRPSGVIVLGGDGTILEAARIFRKTSPLVLGLNLGDVGFLASARASKDFLPAVGKFLRGEYGVAKRMMIKASVVRNGNKVFSTDSLNEVSVQSLLGIVRIEVDIEKHPLQFIRGTGILIATATGSTAYNLSAHGPIVVPEIECMILTEIMDHNIPTPSIVVKKDQRIRLAVLGFRERGILSISGTREAVDVLLIADGETIFPLKKNDEVILERSPHAIKFAELERNYFFKSLGEKFGFK